MTTPTNTKPFNPLVITVAYYLSFIVLGIVVAGPGPSLLSLAERTASTLDQISLIFFFSPLGYVAGAVLGGLAYDRFPGHRLMAISLALTGASAFLVPIMGSLWLLLVVFFVLGLASSVLDVGCNTLLQWIHGEKVSPFMNGLHFFFGVGSSIAPLLLAITGNITWIFWAAALACIPLVVWFWFLPAPQRIHTTEQGKAPFPVVPVILVVVLFILYVGLEIGFGNWVHTYTVKLGLGSESSAAYLTSAFWGSFTLSRLLGVWISTRLRSQAILFMDLLGCLASVIVILLWRESSLALWIGTIGLGVSMASMFATILMFAGERMNISGTVTGFFLFGTGMGGMLLPLMIGKAFEMTGPQAMPTIIAADIVASLLLLAFFVTRRTPGQAATAAPANQG